jgi:hypothetical protein
MKKVEFNLTEGKIFKLFCPDCKRETRHRVVQSVDMNGQEDIDDDFWIAWNSTYQILECQGCSCVSFRSESSNSEDMDPSTGKSLVIEELYPARSKNFLPMKDFWNVPLNLKRIYREVIESFNNELHTLCAGGLRSIIEGICTHQRIKDGLIEVKRKDGSVKSERRKNIEWKIAGLCEKGILTKRNAEVLHECRFLGNEALHELTQPSLDELKLAIQIVEHTLEHIYELPDKAAELHAQAERRRKKHNKVLKRDAAKGRRAS